MTFAFTSFLFMICFRFASVREMHLETLLKEIQLNPKSLSTHSLTKKGKIIFSLLKFLTEEDFNSTERIKIVFSSFFVSIRVLKPCSERPHRTQNDFQKPQLQQILFYLNTHMYWIFANVCLLSCLFMCRHLYEVLRF